MKAYFDLLQSFQMNGTEEINSRTGRRIIMLDTPVSFRFPLDRIPIAGNRKLYPHIAAVEAAWQFMGTKAGDWILKRAPKLWEAFADENNMLQTAYGYRWRLHFGRDQLIMAMNELKTNPSNRQLYISAWDPSCDGLGDVDQPPNIPCPVGFSLTTCKGKLNLSLFIRSSDVFVGLPYDMMTYALTAAAIAKSCNLELGTMHVTLAHAHIYDSDFNNWEKSIKAGHEWVISNIDLPDWKVGEILQFPDDYIDGVKRLTSHSPMNTWKADVEVVV